MVSKYVTVRNPHGFHLKPAGYLCNTALEFDCKITIHIREKYVNAKSVIGVLSACVKFGEEVEVICDGKDQEKALTTMVTCIQDGLGEAF